jgi:outer membrane immunogenic protein
VFIQKDTSGIMGGGYTGFNFEIAPSWVLGIEGDFSFTDLDKTVPCNNPAFNCNSGADWTASLRGRVGYAFDRVMIYGTGGVAWLDYNGFTSLPGVKFKDSETLTGWTVGGGLEWAFTDNLIGRAEYFYADYGKATMQYDVPYPIDPTTNVVRVGLAWKF